MAEHGRVHDCAWIIRFGGRMITLSMVKRSIRCFGGGRGLIFEMPQKRLAVRHLDNLRLGWTPVHPVGCKNALAA